jgi:hypothetical protein
LFLGNKEALEFKGTLQLYVYAVCIDLSCQNLKKCKIKQAAVLVAFKEVGLDVNADKPSHKFMLRHHRAGQNHNASWG